jgi:glucose/arabinose dehydrogenase
MKSVADNRRSSTAVALVALAVMLTACGADGAGSATTAPDTPTTAAPASAAPPTDTTGGTTADSAPPVTAPTATPSPADITLTEVFGDLDRPVEMVWRDGDADPFVVLQRGRIVRVRGGTVDGTVLDVRDELGDEGEQGLLGLAFHPTQDLAYTYTTARDGTLTINEYSVGDDGAFDTTSRRTLLSIDHPNGNHNGGKLVFGPDGYLYIGTGDGGAADDPDRNGLDLDSLLGKLLRIDPRADGGAPYSVPSDNPFVNSPGARPEVWSYGLRNPWRFSFDPASGDLWIGDVGQGEWEEIDLSPAADGGGRAVNFGWSAFEGTHRFNDDQPADGATMPVHEYSHNEGGCSVTGGVVYRGDAISTLTGWYLFADYCSGQVWALRTAAGGAAEVVELVGSAGNIAAIVAGPDNALYLLDHNSGRILRIDPA